MKLMLFCSKILCEKKRVPNPGFDCVAECILGYYSASGTHIFSLKTDKGEMGGGGSCICFLFAWPESLEGKGRKSSGLFEGMSGCRPLLARSGAHVGPCGKRTKNTLHVGLS